MTRLMQAAVFSATAAFVLSLPQEAGAGVSGKSFTVIVSADYPTQNTELAFYPNGTWFWYPPFGFFLNAEWSELDFGRLSCWKANASWGNLGVIPGSIELHGFCTGPLILGFGRSVNFFSGGEQRFTLLGVECGSPPNPD